VQSYEAIKGMFEAFRANRPNATGIIQWMLNSAWPSFYWQLYDYYLLPTAAYYAVKKANEPVQLVYNYGNHQVYAVNSTLKAYQKAIARIKLTDIQGNVISSDVRIVNLDENRSVAVYKVPPYYSTVFLSMTLLDDHNQVVADNFYWLTGNPDVYDWEKTEWFYTPMKSSADFRTLNYLPPAEIELIQHSSKNETEQVIETRINNLSNKIAFFMNIVLKDSANHTVFPVFWDDNYISLLPGESRNLHCTIPGSLDPEMKYIFALSGWNVKEQIINVVP
jgi:exo-1,4-beta-D-glucosaminidase